MAHDVFISHSSKDKAIADAICAHLEGVGVRCWIAPRDIAPGDDWPAAISKAIAHSRIMVLVFSASSNSSEDVSRELILAANSKLVIIPFKIENIEPEPGKQYYLARTHWLDAINPLTQEQIRALIDCVKALIPVRETPPIVEVQPATSLREEQPVRVSEPPKPQPTPRKKVPWVRFLWISGILMVFLCLAVLYVLTFVTHTIPLLGARTTATAKIPATSAPIPAFTAKVGLTGVDLYSGPGENYSKIDFVFTDHVTIIGQAYSCAWLKVTAESSSGPEDGWVSADKVTYTVKCSDVPPAEIPSMPTPISVAPPKLKNLIVLDEFSSNLNSWPSWKNVNDGCSVNSMYIQNGGLLWDINGLDNNWCIYFVYPNLQSVSDFDVSIDADHTAGLGKSDSGIAFRIVDGDNFYIFTVDDASQNFNVRMNQYSNVKTLIDWTYDQVIRSDATNQLAISARGSLFTFLINGKVVATLEDKTFSSGYIGVVADVYDGGSISVKIDNFELYGR